MWVGPHIGIDGGLGRGGVLGACLACGPAPLAQPALGMLSRAALPDLPLAVDILGAKLGCGGGRWGDQGFYVEPTLFYDVEDDMAIARCGGMAQAGCGLGAAQRDGYAHDRGAGMGVWAHPASPPPGAHPPRRDEIFGPVQVILKFGTIDEVGGAAAGEDGWLPGSAYSARRRFATHAYALCVYSAYPQIYLRH